MPGPTQMPGPDPAAAGAAGQLEAYLALMRCAGMS